MVVAGVTVVVVDDGAVVVGGVTVDPVAGCTEAGLVVVLLLLVAVPDCIVFEVPGWVMVVLPGCATVAGWVVVPDATVADGVVVVPVVVVLVGCCAKATNPVSISALRSNFFIVFILMYFRYSFPCIH